MTKRNQCIPQEGNFTSSVTNYYDLYKNFVPKFNHGDIVYWHSQFKETHMVYYGIVDLQMYDDVYINLLAPKETRLIDGIPIEQVIFPTRWETPPKQGFRSKISNDKILQECLNVDITNPQEIKIAYDKGLLVEKGKTLLADVDEEGTAKRERFILKFWEPPQSITSLSVNANRLYFTYAEALNDVEEYNKEIDRIANLTDKEWSIEHIDEVLKRFRLAYQIPEDEILKYRAILLAKEHIEDVEVRTYMGALQWRYWKNKKWLCVDIGDYDYL